MMMETNNTVQLYSSQYDYYPDFLNNATSSGGGANQVLNSNQNSSIDNDEDTNIVETAEQIGHILSFYYTPILVFTGSVGNILSVFVFFKTKLKKLSSSYYLAALAASDTCFLFGLFIQWLNFVDISIYNHDFFCQFFTFFSSLCSFLSVWFVVAFTVERFIAVMYPLKRQSMCTVKRAKIVLCGLTFLGSLHSGPVIFFARPTYSPQLNTTICDIIPEYMSYMKILNYIDTIVVFAVPFTTIVILNTFTGCTVWKFANVRRTMTAHRREKPTTSSDQLPSTCRTNLRKQSSVLHCTHPSGKNSIKQNCSKSGRRKMTNSSQMKVTKMLLIVSSVFVILNLPSYVMRALALEEEKPNKNLIVIQYICWFLFLTNFGINFVLYCVSGQNFRKAVISMFRKVSSSNQKDGTQITEYLRNSGTSRQRPAAQSSGGSWNDGHEMRQIVSIK